MYSTDLLHEHYSPISWLVRSDRLGIRDLVLHFPVKEKAQWILVIADLLFSASENGDQAGAEKALRIYDVIVFRLTQFFDQPEKILVLVDALVPNVQLS